MTDVFAVVFGLTMAIICAFCGLFCVTVTREAFNEIRLRHAAPSAEHGDWKDDWLFFILGGILTVVLFTVSVIVSITTIMIIAGSFS